jgi:hypothetical protein
MASTATASRSRPPAIELVPAIVLLPLVAFDPQGFRFGYGGGYFDRTLAAMVPRPLAIGVGFELGRVTDIRPDRRTTFRSMRRSPRPASCNMFAEARGLASAAIRVIMESYE